MKRVVPILAAATFIGLFTWIVVIADRGDGGKWWPFLEKLPMGDKIGHVGLVGTLSFLCNLAFFLKQPGWLPKAITRVTLILFAILTLEEIAQAFIPTRTCELGDWVANLIGLEAGQFAALAPGKRLAD
jgi:hypothetical protein